MQIDLLLIVQNAATWTRGPNARHDGAARPKRGNFSATWTRGAKLTRNDAIINILGKKNHFECIINVVANFECILMQ